MGLPEPQVIGYICGEEDLFVRLDVYHSTLYEAGYVIESTLCRRGGLFEDRF